MSRSFPDPADELTLALRETLRAALDAFPHLVLDRRELAARLAPALSLRLAEAAAAAGATTPELARALATRSEASGRSAESVEARVLGALKRHPDGRTSGVTPESLATLTGLSPGVLGIAVSTLVQAGDLVRDAWLIRLPQPEDLLPGSRPAEPGPAGELRHATERRAAGDRRAVGERRLYDRRALR